MFVKYLLDTLINTAFQFINFINCLGLLMKLTLLFSLFSGLFLLIVGCSTANNSNAELAAPQFHMPNANAMETVHKMK